MHALDERARWLARNVLPHEPALRAWLLRKLVAGIEIDDIIQETYTRLCLLDSVAAVRDPRSYAFQTAHSVIVSYLRHSRVVPIRSFSQLDADVFIDDVPDPEQTTADRDELSRLGAAIAALPPRIREVFVLRRVDGLSQRQVAEKLGISESTVEKQMSQGFQRLARLFGRGGKAAGGASRGRQDDVNEDHA